LFYSPQNRKYSFEGIGAICFQMRRQKFRGIGIPCNLYTPDFSSLKFYPPLNLVINCIQI